MPGMLRNTIIIAAVLITGAVSFYFIKQQQPGNGTPGSDGLTGIEYTWYCTGDAIVRGKKIGLIKDDVNKLVIALNVTDKGPELFRDPEDGPAKNPPMLRLRGIANGTANVEIINDRHLTQNMGTTGADAYLAGVTFTLTENEEIHSVNFIFREGDHAIPGVYTRKSFASRWKVVE